MARKQQEEKWYSLFNNYDGYNFEEIKKELEEINECELSDNQVWDCISNTEYNEWKEMLSILQKAGGCNKWIVDGSVGRWNGKNHGMKIFENAEEMVQEITQDCDYIKVEYSTKGGLRITASHHDGTNCFDCKLLNYNGLKQYRKWEWEGAFVKYSEYEMLEKLWDSNFYSKLARIKY